MSGNPARCPFCEEVENTETIESWFEPGAALRVIVCHECRASWSVRYVEPEMVDSTEGGGR